MLSFLHQLIEQSAKDKPNNIALQLKTESLTYDELNQQVQIVAKGLVAIGLAHGSRVGIYLNKTISAVSTIFATSKAGGIFVPINPVLKAQQVQHIVEDGGISILVTNQSRLNSLLPILPSINSITHIILVDDDKRPETHSSIKLISWPELLALPNNKPIISLTNAKEATAILYTSGSTGKPKGIVLSHQNMVLGAISVSSYLENSEQDAILALLPLSFDYGLSQLTTAFYVGARCVLFDYFLPKDVLKAISTHGITGLAAVPPLWVKLAQLTWPENIAAQLRYITNSGGALSTSTLKQLQQHLPQTKPYLMYGLTEAFRSTYLDPEQVQNRPTSIGTAIPNAEIIVVREDGSECNAYEHGELVHLGPLVSLGYWNSPTLTAERFKPAPFQRQRKTNDIAVWSGDIVYKDNEGYLYFVSRADDMIKSSGYRISPTEVEEVLTQHHHISQAAVIGVNNELIGQEVIAFINCSFTSNQKSILQEIKQHCAKILPNYMLPSQFIIENNLPVNGNGKIDRVLLHKHYLRNKQ